MNIKLLITFFLNILVMVSLEMISDDICDAEEDGTLALWYSRIYKYVETNQNTTHDIQQLSDKLDAKTQQIQHKIDEKLQYLEKQIQHLENQLQDIHEKSNGNIVIQRRQDGSVDFYRSWNEYKQGFGNKNGEFFIGLDELHKLTNSRPYELLVVLEDWENERRYAKYDQFIVGGENEMYALKSLGSYSGSAGDSLNAHLGKKFSTKDKDNDNSSGEHCAEKYHGAWWYNACHASNLNGRYLKGSSSEYATSVVWQGFRGYYYSLKFVELTLLPK